MYTKKLLLDCTTKPVFSFDNIFYEQTDRVPMGSCLVPVIANIILTESEKAIVDYLIKTGIIAFYRRLVLIKPKDIPFVLNKFNSFDKNLKFTVDNFENSKINFLDLEISDRKKFGHPMIGTLRSTK